MLHTAGYEIEKVLFWKVVKEAFVGGVFVDRGNTLELCLLCKSCPATAIIIKTMTKTPILTNIIFKKYETLLGFFIRF